MGELGTPVIIGRETELARVTSLLDRGVAGLLLEGTVGIGKSTVVAAAVAQAKARDWTVLQCSPASTETGYAYAGLADLITELPDIPAVQRRALEVAIHRVDADQPADPHVVAAATVSVLRALAAEKPVLLVVDDIQWLDAETAAVLDFASRRLGGAPVALLVARRAEHPGAPPWGLDEQLWLSGMTEAQLHGVVHHQLGRSLPRPVLTRLNAVCQGNPMMAVEMAKTPDGPLPDSLVRLVPSRPQSGDVLLAASAMTSPTVEGLRAALDDDVTAGLEAGELAGLIEVHGNTVTFAHPLFAAVIYGEAPAPRRRAVHRRLAKVESDPRHLALGIIGPDEPVAQKLEYAALAAEPMVAAELLTLSRSRTPSHATAANGRRVVMLADALFSSGDLNAARELLDEEIPGLAAGPLRARALMVRGTIAWHQENGVVAAKLLESALDDAKADQELTGQLHARLSVFYETDRAEAHMHAEEAVSALAESDLLPGALMNLCHTSAQLGLPPRTDLLDCGLDDPASPVPGMWYLAVDSTVDRARDRFTTMLARADVSSEADLLTRLGEVELVAGNLSAAKEYADSATTAAMQLGQPFADRPRRLRAFVDAHAGELNEARQIAEDGADRAEANGDLAIAVGYLSVLAFIAASEADPAAVVGYTGRSRRHLATMGIKDPLGRDDPAIERICALAELDRLAEASAELAEFEQRHARLPRPWMEPVLARARATIAAAHGDFSSSIDVNPQWSRFDQARVLLLRGRLLRRARRPGAAATTLTSAEAIFSELKYPLWAAMARAELARVSRRRSAAAQLSETEQRVAELVVSGMTTKQVAATLFMSPRTVESHVARAYRKLGIHSRAELGRAMAG
ncbi:AAA family ATPase [Kibdelosporangium aridum]|uniref:Regulatory protein, luxR family n=1 Tax=Kibdelosporangium aridum TaxID=2030 RepID=A0A1W2B2A9_KIBAR|nr:LuxR family transcriptional regulator [Kibdelosporangium aridum]SMC67113.1 regulatory protein, luxR family [Kibdelosporangium aridum]